MLGVASNIVREMEWKERKIHAKNACGMDFKKNSPIPRGNKKLACCYISIMEMLNNFVLELKNAHLSVFQPFPFIKIKRKEPKRQK